MRMWRLAPVGTVILVLLGGMGTVAGQSDDADTTGAFGPAGSLAEARVFHTATPLPDGRVLIVGGSGDPFPALIEAWDPATGTFDPAGSLAEARVYHTATPLPDGRVLVVGGQGLGDYLTSAEVWDPASVAPERAGTLVGARADHTATLLPDGRVLIVGGGPPRGFHAQAEIWEPTAATFEPTGSLADERGRHTATLLADGRVLVVGGFGIDDRFLDSAEVWDPETERFQPAGSLAEARGHHTATLLDDGRVLIAGGFNMVGGDHALASAEMWDPATATFEPAGSLLEERAGHSATALPIGDILVVGGADLSGGLSALASAEVWDGTVATFEPTGPLSEERFGHTGTLLLDGRVLVVGGMDAGRVPLATAEVWEPAE